MTDDQHSSGQEPHVWTEEDIDEALRRVRESAHEHDDEMYCAGVITGAEQLHRILLDQHAGTPE